MPAVVFESPLGWCALRWNGQGISNFVLAERTREKAWKAIGASEETTVPPKWLAPLTNRIYIHLSGKNQCFMDISLDLSTVTPFRKKVYTALRKVGPGATISYSELAHKIGHPRAARAVGSAMARNPLPLFVPCHRVLSAGLKIGGFSSPGGVITKRKLLQLEGADFRVTH